VPSLCNARGPRSRSFGTICARYDPAFLSAATAQRSLTSAFLIFLFTIHCSHRFLLKTQANSGTTYAGAGTSPIQGAIPPTPHLPARSPHKQNAAPVDRPGAGPNPARKSTVVADLCTLWFSLFPFSKIACFCVVGLLESPQNDFRKNPLAMYLCVFGPPVGYRARRLARPIMGPFHYRCPGPVLVFQAFQDVFAAPHNVNRDIWILMPMTWHRHGSNVHRN